MAHSCFPVCIHSHPEYFAIWKSMWPSNHPDETNARCHDCWKISTMYFSYCKYCWLGLIVDDPRMLISYFAVFMFACFKLRADRLSGFSVSSTYRQMISQPLVLITGTIEYDILHLGYLAFALVFFRVRLEILKKRNKIFKFLRIYNFALIVLSLAYQSPFVGEFCAGKCETVDYIFEMIGFYKYDYGFRITARSALVEIVIFMVVSLQSYMFSSQEFDNVSRYLEAEQIGAIVREQEKKAAWKTAQLKHIRESEEKKHQRNLQVEKIKSEMLNLQIQLHSMNSVTNCGDSPPVSEGLRRRRSTSLNSNNDAGTPDKEGLPMKKEQILKEDSLYPYELHQSPATVNMENPTVVESMKDSMESFHCEITEVEEDVTDGVLFYSSEKKEKVQSIGNQAVNNLVSFLNIEQESDINEHSSVEDGVYDEMESQNTKYMCFNRSSSLQSDTSSDPTSLQLGRIFCHIWSQMRSNNDIVCYCCFVIVFLWNFSLLSMVYLAALFLYALCVNSGPSYIFWVIMLIYTEVYILLQYLYQIIIQHWGLSVASDLLQLITAKDGEWMSLRTSTSIGGVLSMEKRFLYWESLTQGADSPPYFIQVSMDVRSWPDDGIQPERIESGVNQLLRIIHDERCNRKPLLHAPLLVGCMYKALKGVKKMQM
ncbi:piezo-type mechanosensitive ion channel homolog isoform X2 [Prunus yedoensis var. nudiflora]|uniref:Piezo-type mechanosensitive ion channel homolog isoform X2 n=1 Tax=Prunus yedoensis var. nudiflora TaxID=2094558 RepID=A0A314UDQ3_PRUYE|nr:piezo-type mechanosensitive ion channel homolog isoform X2 [Prunus yedoensis var. nudiflora]